MVTGDLADPGVRSAVEEAWRSLRRERGATVHLAGMADAGACRLDPAAASVANVALTRHVAELSVRLGMDRLVFPSTAHVYGDQGFWPVDESSALDPIGVYAETKVEAEAVLEGMSGALTCVVARLSNVYGARSNPVTAMGRVLDQIRKTGIVSLRSFAPIRDFIFLGDVVDGLIELVAMPDAKPFEVLNLSTGQPTSLGDIARMAMEVAGLAGEPICEEATDGASSYLVLDNGRLRSRTGWSPSVDLRAGLEACLEGEGAL